MQLEQLKLQYILQQCVNAANASTHKYLCTVLCSYHRISDLERNLMHICWYSSVIKLLYAKHHCQPFSSHFHLSAGFHSVTRVDNQPQFFFLFVLRNESGYSYALRLDDIVVSTCEGVLYARLPLVLLSVKTLLQTSFFGPDDSYPLKQ